MYGLQIHMHIATLYYFMVIGKDDPAEHPHHL